MSLQRFCRPWFSTKALLAFVAGQVLMVRQCPVHSRMFSRIPFYPLDDSGTLSKFGQPKISSDILGGQLVSRIQSQCSRTRTLSCWAYSGQAPEKLIIPVCLLTINPWSHYLPCLKLSLYKDLVQVHALQLVTLASLLLDQFPTFTVAWTFWRLSLPECPEAFYLQHIPTLDLSDCFFMLSFNLFLHPLCFLQSGQRVEPDDMQVKCFWQKFLQ